MTFKTPLFLLALTATIAGAPAHAQRFGQSDPADRLKQADANHDGVVTRAEFAAARKQQFDQMDHQRTFADVTPPRSSELRDFVIELAAYRNDLQPAAEALSPEIGKTLDLIRSTEGCLLARMSGSGSTCFGLYADQDAAAQAAERIQRGKKKYWVRQTLLRGAPPMPEDD